jgi:hypothetical protein
MTEVEELKKIVLAQANRIEGLARMLYSQGAEICDCGHFMGEHVEGMDSCSQCGCQQFRSATANTEQER